MFSDRALKCLHWFGELTFLCISIYAISKLPWYFYFTAVSALALQAGVALNVLIKEKQNENK